VEKYLNKRVSRLVEDLLCGDVTLQKFHNSKAKAKRDNNTQEILDLAISFELYKIRGKV